MAQVVQQVVYKSEGWHFNPHSDLFKLQLCPWQDTLPTLPESTVYSSVCIVVVGEVILFPLVYRGYLVCDTCKSALRKRTINSIQY